MRKTETNKQNKIRRQKETGKQKYTNRHNRQAESNNKVTAQ